MPKVFEIEGYRGFFYSNEGSPLEPVHIHIKKGEGEAKFWVTPTVSLAESWNLKVSELSRAQEMRSSLSIVRKSSTYGAAILTSSHECGN